MQLCMKNEYNILSGLAQNMVDIIHNLFIILSLNTDYHIYHHINSIISYNTVYSYERDVIVIHYVG